MNTTQVSIALAFLTSLGCAPVGEAPSNPVAAGSGGAAGLASGGAGMAAGVGGSLAGASGAGSGSGGSSAGLGGISGVAGAMGGSSGSAGGGSGGMSGAAAAPSTGGAAGEGGSPSGGASSGGQSGAGQAGAATAGGAGAGGTVSDPGTEGDGDVTIGPNYADSPDLASSNVPRGEIYDFTMSSTESAIYKGDDATLLAANQHAFERAIRVYVPSQYVDGTPAPFMVVQDGYVGDITRALDNLIAETDPERRLPAIVAIFVANGGGDSKGSQRGLEYDTLSDRYTRFIDTEVLPAVVALPAILADRPNFALTDDPEGRAAYGCSSGGAAAFTMGWFPADRYRRIITYSGTFVDQQDDDAAEEVLYPLGAWEYHDRLIAAADKKPLRVFLQVSENDNGAGDSEAGHHNWVMANERMAEVLGAKGNHYRFVYALGAGHCDGAVRRQTLPETLLWTWRGYPVD